MRVVRVVRVVSVGYRIRFALTMSNIYLIVSFDDEGADLAVVYSIKVHTHSDVILDFKARPHSWSEQLSPQGRVELLRRDLNP